MPETVIVESTFPQVGFTAIVGITVNVAVPILMPSPPELFWYLLLSRLQNLTELQMMLKMSQCYPS